MGNEIESADYWRKKYEKALPVVNAAVTYIDEKDPSLTMHLFFMLQSAVWQFTGKLESSEEE
jgi:hypothetical protein